MNNHNRNSTGDLLKLIRYLPRHRKFQLIAMLMLAGVSALSEVISLGALLPFLSAISDPKALAASDYLKPFSKHSSFPSPEQLAIWATVIFIIVAIAANLLKLVTIWFQSKLIAAVSSDLSVAYYRSNLLQPYTFYLNHNSSEIVSGATEHIDRTAGIVYACLNFLLFFLTIVAISTTLLLVDWKITLGGIILLGILIMPVIQQTKQRLASNSREIVRCSHNRIKIIQESTGGMRDILLDGSQSFFLKKYSQADYSLRQRHASSQFMAAFNRPYMEGIAMTAIAVLALVMLQAETNLSRVLPILGTLVLGLNRLLPSLQQCYSCWAWIKSNEASLGDTLAVMARSVEMTPRIQAMPLSQMLHLENIWFRYQANNKWILKGLDIKISANTTVGFAGESGCGKSTTADIILGLLTPEKGKISIDGHALSTQESRLSWQRSVAHVPQSIYLSDASISENIAFGVDPQEIDFDKVKEAARLARISEFVEQLPQGYEEEVGERGVRLSGGQRQRIGIARALYKEASVIVFDEATSALDNDTEQEVMDAIYGLSRRVTLIIIAHRLSTLRNCDRIFEFQNGEIVAAGDYCQMTNLSTRFSRLALT